MKKPAYKFNTVKFRSGLIAVITVGVASFTWWLTISAAFAPNFPFSSLPDIEVTEQVENVEQNQDPENYQEIEITVQSGDTLTHIFERHALKIADLYQILQLKQFKPQLTQLHLEQKISILHDDEGHVVDLMLQLGSDKELLVYKNDFGFDGEILQDGEPVLVSLAQHSVIDNIQNNENTADTTAETITAPAVATQTIKKDIPSFKDNRLTLKIQSGDTLYKIFRQHKLSLADLERILKLHRKSRSYLQNLNINQKLVVIRTNNNRVKTLSLDIGHHSTLHFTKQDNGFKGEIEKNGTRVALDYRPPSRQIAAQQHRTTTVEKPKVETTKSVAKQSYTYPSAASPKLSEMIQSAKQYLGYPYRYGGESPRGFDCSGFVIYNSKKAGISHLPRTAHQQYRHTKPVSRDNLQPGDLVFFHSRNNRSRIGHVGIYIGDDKFIHARAKGPKDVTITSLNNSYYRKHFVRGGRL